MQLPSPLVPGWHSETPWSQQLSAASVQAGVGVALGSPKLQLHQAGDGPREGTPERVNWEEGRWGQRGFLKLDFASDEGVGRQ